MRLPERVWLSGNGGGNAEASRWPTMLIGIAEIADEADANLCAKMRVS